MVSTDGTNDSRSSEWLAMVKAVIRSESESKVGLHSVAHFGECLSRHVLASVVQSRLEQKLVINMLLLSDLPLKSVK